MTTRTRSLLSLLLCLALLCGCAEPKAPPHPAYDKLYGDPGLEPWSAAAATDAVEGGGPMAGGAKDKTKDKAESKKPPSRAAARTGGVAVGGAALKAAEADQRDGGERQRVTLNFDRADLAQVTNQIFSSYIKENYVLDPSLRGQLSLYIEGEYTRGELLDMIAKAYRANNVDLVRRDGVWLIQPLKATQANVAATPGRKGEPTVIVYRLNFMTAAQALKIIRSFIATERAVVEEPMTNSLIFVEDPDRAMTIVRLLKALDVNVLAETGMEIVPLTSLTPQQAVKSMDALMGRMAAFKQSALGQNVAFIPLEHFRGVLIISQSQEMLVTSKQWLEALDAKGQEAGETIHVYFVENGSAVEIANLLNAVYGAEGAQNRVGQRVVSSTGRRTGSSGFGSSSSGFGSSSSGFGSSNSGLGGSSSSGFGGSSSFGGSGFGSTNQQGQTGSGLNTASGSTSPQGGQVSTASAQSGLNTTGAAGGFIAGGTIGSDQGGGPVSPDSAALAGPVRIIPDETNNAVVIRAGAADFEKIRRTIETLDIVPRAVLIEVLLAEVTLSDNLEYGVQWFFRKRFGIGGEDGRGGAGLGGINPITGTSPSSTDRPFNAFWSSVNGDIGALISLLGETSPVNVLANPTLLAADNKEASFTVGGRQPILTQSSQSTIGDSNVINSVQYEETGIILNVIPHINSGGLVRLDVEQTTRDVGPSVTLGTNTQTPSFTERKIKTSLIAHDGKTVLIGGIIQNRNKYTHIGIPGLKDVPGIWPLFSTKTKELDRTELLIAITPRIVKHERDAAMQEFAERLGDVRRMLQGTQEQKPFWP